MGAAVHDPLEPARAGGRSTPLQLTSQKDTQHSDELQRLVESKTLPMETALATAVDKEDFKRRFRSGITLAAAPNDPSRFRVMAVVPDSPGARAGLRRGDMIVEANKQDADQFTLDDLRSLFRTDGKHALVVERSGKRERVQLELSR